MHLERFMQNNIFPNIPSDRKENHGDSVHQGADETKIFYLLNMQL